jgi:hypothetical protein
LDTVLHKIFAVILVVLGLGLVPLVNSIQVDDSRAQRLELNYTQNYLDVICDKGVLSEADYNNFSALLTSTGYLYKISVELEIRRVYTSGDPASTTLEVYHVLSTAFSSETGGVKNTSSGPNILAKGDIVTVRIAKLHPSRVSQVFGVIYRLFLSPKDITLKGMVRNDG